MSEEGDSPNGQARNSVSSFAAGKVTPAALDLSFNIETFQRKMSPATASTRTESEEPFNNSSGGISPKHYSDDRIPRRGVVAQRSWGSVGTVGSAGSSEPDSNRGESYFNLRSIGTLPLEAERREDTLQGLLSSNWDDQRPQVPEILGDDEFDIPGISQLNISAGNLSNISGPQHQQQSRLAAYSDNAGSSSNSSNSLHSNADARSMLLRSDSAGSNYGAASAAAESSSRLRSSGFGSEVRPGLLPARITIPDAGSLPAHQSNEAHSSGVTPGFYSGNSTPTSVHSLPAMLPHQQQQHFQQQQQQRISQSLHSNSSYSPRTYSNINYTAPVPFFGAASPHLQHRSALPAAATGVAALPHQQQLLQQQQQQQYGVTVDSQYPPQRMPSMQRSSAPTTPTAYNSNNNSAHAPAATLNGAPPGNIYLVRFKRMCRSFVLGAQAHPGTTVGDFVVVEADRGEDLGVVTEVLNMKAFIDRRYQMRGSSSSLSTQQQMQSSMAQMDEDDHTVGRIIRPASMAERMMLPEKFHDEQLVVQLCKELASHTYRLPMAVIDAEYQFDRHKLTIYYNSSGRIDFRELVRDLFSAYKARIWMKKVNQFQQQQQQETDQFATTALATGLQFSPDMAPNMAQLHQPLPPPPPPSPMHPQQQQQQQQQQYFLQQAQLQQQQQQAAYLNVSYSSTPPTPPPLRNLSRQNSPYYGSNPSQQFSAGIHPAATEGYSNFNTQVSNPPLDQQQQHHHQQQQLNRQQSRGSSDLNPSSAPLQQQTSPSMLSLQPQHQSFEQNDVNIVNTGEGSSFSEQNGWSQQQSYEQSNNGNRYLW